MSRFRLITSSFLLTLMFAFAAFAQAQPTSVALVDTRMFYDEKEGISKIASAYKSLELEFKTTTTELENISKRLATLETEIKSIQAKFSDPANKVPLDENAARAKVDEAQKLQRDFKYKEDEFKARLAKREQIVIGPVLQDIAKALDEFAKKKGYSVVFDFGVLIDERIILYLDPSADITKEFVTMYNARPTGSAASKP